MTLSTVFYASEINFLTGFAEICLFDDFIDNKAPKILWGLRMVSLAVLFGLWSYTGFNTACVVLLILSLVIYSVSSSLGQKQAELTKPTDYELCFVLANISVVNWVFAIPFSLGPEKRTERGVWLFLNFLAFAIIAGVYFTDGPMRTGWGCYPPSVPWDQIGAAGICPQNPKGSYITCNTPPVKSSAYLACQSFGWVESLGSGGVRVAILIAAISVGVYIASIPRNLREADRMWESNSKKIN